MEHLQKIIDSVYHLARLALVGTRPEILVQINRLERRLRQTDPVSAERLNALLAEQPTQASPVRSATAAGVPVDSDSRLHLARVDYPVEIDVEPNWAEVVSRPLTQVVAERSKEAMLRSAGLAPSRSMLFVGPPGVGKTLAASWLARALDRPLVTLDLSAVMNRFLGRTGGNIRQVLDYAKGIECVLFLDELDAVAKRRDDEAEIGELKRLVTVLLQEIDGWPDSGILIAATNHPDLLDPAIWRRFDIVVDFPLPDADQVRRQLRTLVGDKISDPMLEAVTLSFGGSSYSDIDRELLRARRESIIHGQPLEERIERSMSERIQSLSRAEKNQAAQQLLTAGMSARRASELTGLDRRTIGKNKGKRSPSHSDPIGDSSSGT